MDPILATIDPFVRATPEVSWQTAMKRAIRSAGELASRLNLPLRSENLGENVDLAAKASIDAGFPVFVPLEFLRRIEPGNPHDPLLLQVMPHAEENFDVAGFTTDPVGEVAAAGNDLAGGVLRKYPGRALLIAHQACGVHCRYCFRRHFPYQVAAPDRHSWTAALTELNADESIEEVILSGGDPLVLTDPALAALIEGIERVPHVRRLRIHSRLPIVIPQRVTTDLVEMLRSTRLVPWMVVHINHPAELDEPTSDALARLIDNGIPVLNQAVLLRGVNDNLATLEELCRKLINRRIQPYYLHQLDRVAGAAHFEVEQNRGLELVRQLRERIPGYAVPTYVCEQPAKQSKTLVTDTNPSSNTFDV